MSEQLWSLGSHACLLPRLVTWKYVSYASEIRIDTWVDSQAVGKVPWFRSVGLPQRQGRLSATTRTLASFQLQESLTDHLEFSTCMIDLCQVTKARR
jgi:hypothetical protein